MEPICLLRNLFHDSFWLVKRPKVDLIPVGSQLLLMLLEDLRCESCSFGGQPFPFGHLSPVCQLLMGAWVWNPFLLVC